jgi:methylthioribose-1-phosphate isomerase
MQPIQAVAWSADGDGVRILDQRLLPERELYRDLRTVDEVCDAINTLAVRGAPAIGIAAAMGVAISVRPGTSSGDAAKTLKLAAAKLRGTRPTAVNLSRALDRMTRIALSHQGDARELRDALRAEATAILDEDRAMCRRIGEFGATLIADRGRVLTHCNTGALATGGIGTALAAVYVAVESGKRVEVYADETRPLLQGSRLTAWELQRAGIPVTILADGAAASLLRDGDVDLCLVGADRIATNGDVANKVGTYPLAIAAGRHSIPFYVAAPSSTFDPATARGDAILIEQRAPDELRRVLDKQTAPADVAVYNPAFDVTPAELISAIVSDRGVHRPPFDFSGLES